MNEPMTQERIDTIEKLYVTGASKYALGPYAMSSEALADLIEALRIALYELHAIAACGDVNCAPDWAADALSEIEGD